MSRRNSLSRFSFSASNISSPIAESTKIGSPRSSEYELLGSRQFLHNEKSVIVENKLQSVIPKSVSSVDPKTYTDVQSRGLVSRIIKYHDNRKLNRSMSSSSLYNKPGEFPIVHLKKNEIRYSPRRNQILSGTRIAPPDKSVFQANTRSSILRSGTILSAQALEKTDDKGLRDNEPIVLSEGEIDPSRNSLDALKEISRKRINSDEIDSNDAYKKYRKEYVYDEYNSFGSKRQRESQTSPKSPNEGNVEQIVKKRMFRKNNDILSSLSSSLHINSPKRKISDLQPVTTSPRRSPVPPSAKQQCNDNNYIRPVYNDKVILNAKPQEKNVTAVAPRQPISRTYIEKEVIKKAVEQKPKLTLFNARYDTTPNAGKLDMNAEKHTNGNLLDDEEEDDTAGISFVKPKNNKLSLKTTNAALEQQRKTKLQMMLSFLNGDADDEGRDEVDVTTRVATSQENKSDAIKASSSANETPKNVQTTSGGFTFGSTSTAASNTSSALTTTTSINDKPIMSNQTTVSSTGFSFGLTSTTSTSTAPSVQTSSAAAEPPAPLPPSTSAGFSFGDSATSVPSTTAITSTSSKLPSPPPTFGSFSKPNLNPTSSTTTVTTSGSSFSFGLSKPASSETIQPAGLNNSFSFNTAIAASSASSAVTTSAPTVNTTPGFSFGGTTVSKPATTSTTSIFGNSSNAPSKPISFGVSTKTNENQQSISETSSSSNPWAMQKPSLPVTFSSQEKTDQKPTETSTPKPIFGTNSAPATFGNTFSGFAPKTSSSTEVVKPQQVFGGDIGVKTGTNIFGGNNDAKTTTSSSASLFSQPAFGFVGSSGNNNQTEPKPVAAPSFNFGGNTSNTTVAKTTPSATPFAFGGSIATSNDNTAQKSSPFAFGTQNVDTNKNNNNNNNNNNGNPGFSFNTNQPKAPFGTPNAENKPNFSFGQSAAPAATDNKPSFSFSQTSAPAPSATENKPSFNFGQSTASTTADNKPNFNFNQNTAPSSSAFSFKPVATSNTTGSGVNNDISKTFGVGGGGDGKSIFGAASNNGPSEVKPFAFGGIATDKNNTQPASNLFAGPTSTPNKSFSFTAKSFPSPNPNLFGSPASSSNNNNNNNSNNSASIFGGSNGPSNSNQPFTFGGSSSSTNQQASSAPFAFGASSSNANQAKDSSSPAPFAFGTSTSNSNQGKENSKPFAFGASNSNSQPAMSFGSSGSNKPTMPVFGSQQTSAAANNPFAPPPSVNPFSAGPGASGGTQTNSYGRTIRTATRRLK